jgi:hypothetical protein
MTWAAGRIVPLLAAAMLSACAGTPREDSGLSEPPAQPAAAPAPAATPAPALVGFEITQRERARRLQRESLWPDARRAWAVVLALRPDDIEAQAGWAYAETAARATAQERALRAERARSHGDTEAAMRLNLEALAHDPDLPGPAEALRTLERKRALRAPPQTFARARSTVSSPELEHAQLLAAEGHIDAALAVLEPLARAPRADAGLRRRVCDLLMRVAEAQAAPAVALATVQRCLQLLPQHAAALQRARALAPR